MQNKDFENLKYLNFVRIPTLRKTLDVVLILILIKIKIKNIALITVVCKK